MRASAAYAAAPRCQAPRGRAPPPSLTRPPRPGVSRRSIRGRLPMKRERDVGMSDLIRVCRCWASLLDLSRIASALASRL
eukprot:10335717-Lingulodinium_polyedra.AAC.1